MIDTTRATTLPETLELFGYWRSSASWRVRWALELKGALYKYTPINLLKGEHLEESFLKLSPSSSVPVILVNQKNILNQSMPIIEWVEETYNLEEAQLFWGDSLNRAKIRELCEIINSDTAPLQTPRAQKLHSKNEKEQKTWASYWIARGLSVFDKASDNVRGKWSVGDQISAADLFVVPQIYNALRFDVDVKKEFPKLWSIYEAALRTPECHKASPEQQIDAVIK